MWFIRWEVYGVSCTGLCVKLEVPWEGLSDYVVALRSSLNLGCHLFFKDTHVDNCFKGDVSEWCFNWHAESFLMTSCTFGCYILCICFCSNASRVTSTRASEITWRWVRLWWLDFHIHSLMLQRLHWLSFILARETCLNGYHLKCDMHGCCFHWHEEYVRNLCASPMKIQEVGSQSQTQFKEGHTMNW